ncbi:MAG: hypothetical protein HQL55_13270 [Magnetococcales bacterium]|nr:hypothetical protein [Magnetococcales bacterium]
MHPECLTLPPHEVIQRHVRQALSRYWFVQELDPSVLPIQCHRPAEITGPLRLHAITLPDWGAIHGVEGIILIPLEASPHGDDWQKVDWWLGAFLLLECWHERTWELHHGPIHSYSFRLEGWDERAWDHAWVNRIALFLRSWWAHLQDKSAEWFEASLPATEILMTHDVDAVGKILPIRLKQGAFNLYNAVRALLNGDPGTTFDKIGVAVRFLLGREAWEKVNFLLAMEKQLGIRAYYNFYADSRPKNLQRWLFDPDYDVESIYLRDLLRRVQEQGGMVGLHPTFDAWESAIPIRDQRERLSRAANIPVKSCRQHWLRFSWHKTWAAQVAAGIEQDTTLMFNDRPGFRASAALVWHPWEPVQGCCHTLLEYPSVLMDSHFYDYQPLSDVERKKALQNWLGEVALVKGQIGVLWHPHTLTKDYGWEGGFQDLLLAMAEIRSC